MRLWTAGIALGLALAGGAARGQVLGGVVDVHAHSAPDESARSIDGVRLAAMAQARGLRAIVLKNHFESTASLAELAARAAPRLTVFGGVALNRPVGGINPAAVEHCVKIRGVKAGPSRCKVVWMPTFDSEHMAKSAGTPEKPHVSVSKDGMLLPEVLQVLDLIAKHNLVLATGHSSPAEDLMLVREAAKRGVKGTIVTHPIHPMVGMTVEQCREAAGLGAYLEFTGNSMIGVQKFVSFEEVLKQMRAVGLERVVLSSDLGQAGNPLHPAGWHELYAGFRKAGLTPQEWNMITKRNPAAALGLE
jgi:hypothetical protein